MNGNIAGLLVGLVVVLLAANGKLTAIGKAITTKGETTAQSLGGGVFPGTASAVTDTAGKIPKGVAPAGTVDAPITKPIYASVKLPNAYPIPTAGSNPAFDSVANNWPAGYETEWQAFKVCYQAHGSIADCVVLSAAGKG